MGNSQYPSQEESRMRMMADALGPDIANAVYEMPNGQNFYDAFGNKEGQPAYNANQNQGGVQMNGYGNNNGGQDREMRYANEAQNEWKVSPPHHSGESMQGAQNNFGFDQETWEKLPRVHGKRIVRTAKDTRGNLLAFQLEDGTKLDYYQMLEANAQGGFSGLGVQRNREGELIIRSASDGYPYNNLDALPTFH